MAFKPSIVVKTLGFGAFLSRGSSSESRNTISRGERKRRRENERE